MGSFISGWVVRPSNDSCQTRYMRGVNKEPEGVQIIESIGVEAAGETDGLLVPANKFGVNLGYEPSRCLFRGADVTHISLRGVK